MTSAKFCKRELHLVPVAWQRSRRIDQTLALHNGYTTGSHITDIRETPRVFTPPSVIRIVSHFVSDISRVLRQLMPRKYWPHYRPLSSNWPKIERDITNRMNMFKSYLNSLPKNRLDYVEDLDIPDITLTPYLWTYPEDYYYSRRGSYLSDRLSEYDKATLSTDSSIPLSRAMTDSEIDYEFYKRYKNCYYTDKWRHLRDAVYAFPSDYLASLDRYMYLDTDVDDELLNSDLKYATELAENRRRYNEERRRRLRRKFEEDCRVYSPGDPGLLELQEQLRELDMKNLEADLANIRTYRSRLRSRLALNRLRRTLYDTYWW